MLTPDSRGIYKGKGRAHKNPWDLNEGRSQLPHNVMIFWHPASVTLPLNNSLAPRLILLDSSCMSSFE